MLNPAHVREFVVQPALRHIGLHSEVAEELVLLTGMIESRLSQLWQLPRGPAMGLFQMEPNTHDDIWKNFLAYRRGLREKVESLLIPNIDRREQLRFNLVYAAAMCRVMYYRVPSALPHPTLTDLSWYWKHHYNTLLGKGKPKKFVHQAERLWLLEGVGYNRETDWRSTHWNAEKPMALKHTFV